MGLYLRTIEMSRHRRFACFRCGPAVFLRERLVTSTELELTCATGCQLVVLIVTHQPIPRTPDDLRGVIRYRGGGRLLDHGGGFRCHNCGRRLAYDTHGKGPYQCSRCHTWHYLGTVLAPPHRPRVLPCASGVSSSPPGMPASSAR